MIRPLFKIPGSKATKKRQKYETTIKANILLRPKISFPWGLCNDNTLIYLILLIFGSGKSYIKFLPMPKRANYVCG